MVAYETEIQVTLLGVKHFYFNQFWLLWSLWDLWILIALTDWQASNVIFLVNCEGYIWNPTLITWTYSFDKIFHCIVIPFPPLGNSPLLRKPLLAHLLHRLRRLRGRRAQPPTEGPSQSAAGGTGGRPLSARKGKNFLKFSS